MSRIGVLSEAWKLAQTARHIPEILDPQAPGGGVMRLLTNAGGAVVNRDVGRIKSRTPPTIVEAADGTAEQVDQGSIERELGPLRGTGPNLPLLIRHETESSAQFAFRSAIAAPRSAFWASVDSLAARPWSRGVRYGDDVVVPEALELDSELMQNVNCSPSDPRSLLNYMLDISRSSSGLGLTYVMVDWSVEADRWFFREMPARYAPRVQEDKLGVAWMEFHLSPHVQSNGTRHERVQRFVRAFEPIPLLDGVSLPTAAHVIYRSKQPVDYVTAKNMGDAELWEIELQVVGGVERPVVELAPHQAIPVVPLPTGRINDRMKGAHYIHPPLIDAAKLDHLLLQITSNVEFATLVANTFMRFARGLNPEDIDEWEEIGAKLFYATQAEKADMKWVTLPAEALTAGMELQTAIVRAIEVAGLSPMLTRETIHAERATGQAITAERAGVVAEGYALRAFGQWSRLLTFARDAEIRQPLSTNGNADPIRILGHSDFGVKNMENAQLLTKIYLDPQGGLPAADFWAEMFRHGVISEEIDAEELARMSDPELRRKDMELQQERVKALQSLPQNGFMVSTADQREAYLKSLRAAGVLEITDKEAKDFARQDELAGILIRGNLQTLRTAQAGGGL